MSQRTFRHRDLNVLTGWDRQLGGFYLVVESDEQSVSDTDDYIFTNLKLPNPAMTAVEVKFHLWDLAIPWPPSLLEDLEADRYENRVNLKYHYPEV